MAKKYNPAANYLGRLIGEQIAEHAGDIISDFSKDYFEEKKAKRENEQMLQMQIANLPSICSVCGAPVNRELVKKNNFSCIYCDSNLLPQNNKL